MHIIKHYYSEQVLLLLKKKKSIKSATGRGAMFSGLANASDSWLHESIYGRIVYLWFTMEVVKDNNLLGVSIYFKMVSG